MAYFRAFRALSLGLPRQCAKTLNRSCTNYANLGTCIRYDNMYDRCGHVSYSTAVGADNIVRCPDGDIDIPTNINLSHYMLDAFRKHGDRPAMVSSIYS